MKKMLFVNLCVNIYMIKYKGFQDKVSIAVAYVRKSRPPMKDDYTQLRH